MYVPSVFIIYKFFEWSDAFEYKLCAFEAGELHSVLLSCHVANLRGYAVAQFRAHSTGQNLNTGISVFLIYESGIPI